MDIFIQASKKYLPVLKEYYRLECQQALSETEANRIQEILEEAEQDPQLDFLIDELDHILGHEMGLIDEKIIQQQQQKLKPEIDSAWLENQVRSNLSSLENSVNSNSSSLKEAQTRLKQEGIYSGRIDGVFGPITKQAFRALRRQLREQLKKQGLPTDSIDKILKMDKSVIERIRQEGKNIDIQAVELLNLEAIFF